MTAPAARIIPAAESIADTAGDNPVIILNVLAAENTAAAVSTHMDVLMCHICKHIGIMNDLTPVSL